jgi:hypothetical protein
MCQVRAPDARRLNFSVTPASTGDSLRSQAGAQTCVARASREMGLDPGLRRDDDPLLRRRSRFPLTALDLRRDDEWEC